MFGRGEFAPTKDRAYKKLTKILLINVRTIDLLKGVSSLLGVGAGVLLRFKIEGGVDKL